MNWNTVLQMKIGKWFLQIDRMKIKAISLHQPWASMIAQGVKTIETRLWYTPYRGELLIVSTKKPEIEGLLCGFALCVVKIIDCRPMLVSDECNARCVWERRLYSWVLDDIRKIKPFRVRGYQGIYEVEIEE